MEGDGGEVTFTILLTTTLFSIVVVTGFVMVVLVVVNGAEVLFAAASHIAVGEGSWSAMLQLSIFLFCFVCIDDILFDPVLKQMYLY